jgi:hypothetical protein
MNTDKTKFLLPFGILGVAILIVLGSFIFLSKFKPRQNGPKASPTPAQGQTPTEATPTRSPNSDNSDEDSALRGEIKALEVYKKDQLSQEEQELLDGLVWPKLKPFESGDAAREVYLVNCQVTNDELGFSLKGIPVEVPNAPNVAELTLKELVSKGYGGFPSREEISDYEKASGLSFNNDRSGINSLALKNGVLTINFYDSVAAYGGGSARVSCLSLAASLTAKQFPSIKEVKMCLDKTDNCELDFQP